jgi:hypothetical protein
MIRPLLLALPDPSKQFVIKIDVLRVRIRAVLIQEAYPIAYINKSLSPRQQAISTYEREILISLYTVAKWRHYLWGRHFKIHIDRVSLKYLLEQKVTYPSHHL